MDPMFTSTFLLCLHYRPETVHCNTKNAYTSEITFLALHTWLSLGIHQVNSMLNMQPSLNYYRFLVIYNLIVQKPSFASEPNFLYFVYRVPQSKFKTNLFTSYDRTYKKQIYTLHLQMHYVGRVFYYKWSVDVILLTLSSNLSYQVSEAEMRKPV